MKNNDFNNLHLYCGDAMEFYDNWESPTVIVSDGPYGINGFKGDLLSHKGLDFGMNLISKNGVKHPLR